MRKRFFLLLLCVLLLPIAAHAELTTVRRTDGIYTCYDYVDENGTITKNEAMGYATLRQLLDEQGDAAEEYYLDAQGQPVARWGGQYGIKRSFRDHHCIAYTYVDQDGRPMMVSAGYATVKRIFNDQMQIVGEDYFDAEDQPVALTPGHCGVRKSYNEAGLNDSITYVDAQGKPMTITSHYSTVKYEYDAEGQILREWYFDTEGAPLDMGRGQYGIQRLYEDGAYVSSAPVGADGQPLFFFDAYLQQQPLVVVMVAMLLVAWAAFGKPRMSRILLAAYVLFILYMTLLVRESGDKQSNLELFWSYRQLFSSPKLGLEVINNILLFVPLGALLYAWKPKLWVLLPAVGLTFAIEGSQYLFGLGLCELDDLFGNSLGALLGWLSVSGIRRLYKALHKVK